MVSQSRRSSSKKDVTLQISDLKPKTFEEAITATGFGKFNIILLFMIVPAMWTTQFQTSNMSFVFPVAQCDLNLTLDDKGQLNAAPYIGMMLMAYFWGMISDRFGRKKVLVTGYCLLAFLMIVSSFSKSFIMLIVLNFLSGLIISGPSTSLTAYISEITSLKYRSRMLMSFGLVCSAGNVILPVLASVILPMEIKFSFFDNLIVINAWNIFILVTALAPVTSAIGFILMPNTPKHLMTKGENGKALEVLRNLYHWNTGNPKELYPITHLIEECGQKTKDDKNEENTDRWIVFKPPYLRNVILICFIQMCLIMSINTIRLWVPQVFQAVHEYQVSNNGTTGSLCQILDTLKPDKEGDALQTCSVNLDKKVYFNSMVIGGVAMVTYILAITFINKFNPKKMLLACGIISGSFISTVFLAQNTETIMALISIFLALANVCNDLVITMTVVIFPTSVRAQALAISTIFNRLGSFVGNMVFPILLKTGCMPPFFIVGIIIITASISTVLLPNLEGRTVV